MKVTLVIFPNPNAPGRYFGSVGGKVLVNSKEPFFAASRRLLDGNHDPSTVLEMRHEGSDTIALRSTIGAAAGLRVSENKSGTPIIRKWRPAPSRREAADVNTVKK